MATDKTVEGIILSTEYYTEKINNLGLANEINDGVASDVSIRLQSRKLICTNWSMACGIWSCQKTSELL